MLATDVNVIRIIFTGINIAVSTNIVINLNLMKI